MKKRLILIILILIPVTLHANPLENKILSALQQQPTKSGTTIEEYLDGLTAEKDTGWQVIDRNGAYDIKRVLTIEGKDQVYTWSSVIRDGKINYGNKTYHSHSIMPKGGIKSVKIPYAQQPRQDDGFDGLKTQKKSGAVVIDYTSEANRIKLQREAIISGQKAKKKWAKIRADQERERIWESRRSYNYNSSPSYRSKSKYNPKSGAGKETSYYKKKLREIDQEEKNTFQNKWERKYNNERKAKYKAKIKDIERHPEDY